MPDTLGDAPAAADRSGEKTNFRLAALGAVLVVVLFTAYGIGRLSEGGTATAPGAATSVAADGHAHGAGSATDGGSGTTGHDGAGPAGHDGAGTAGHDGAGTAPHDDTGTAPHQHNADGSVTPLGGNGNAGGAVGGLAVTSAGLTLTPQTTTFSARRAQALRFIVAGPGGAPVTTFATVHDKPLHLIVIRRDLTGFQHLHPTMAPDGTWSVDLTLAAPGSYRAIADFTALVGGQPVATTLGVDLTVPGDYAPVPLPAPVRVSKTDGFTVQYEGVPRTGSTQPLFMSVTGADSKAVAVEPYLGAFGHLVALREGDVGYVHVHPEEQPVDGKLKFWLAAPGPGQYRLFFDFQVGGRVHTAAWTAVVS